MCAKSHIWSLRAMLGGWFFLLSGRLLHGNRPQIMGRNIRLEVVVHLDA